MEAQAELVTTFVPSRFRTVSRVLQVLDWRLISSLFLSDELLEWLPADGDPVGEQIPRVPILRSLSLNGQTSEQALGRRGGRDVWGLASHQERFRSRQGKAQGSGG